MNCPNCHTRISHIWFVDSHVTKSGVIATIRKGHCEYCNKDVKKTCYKNYHKKVKGPAE